MHVHLIVLKKAPSFVVSWTQTFIFPLNFVLTKNHFISTQYFVKTEINYNFIECLVIISDPLYFHWIFCYHLRSFIFPWNIIYIKNLLYFHLIFFPKLLRSTICSTHYFYIPRQVHRSRLHSRCYCHTSTKMGYTWSWSCTTSDSCNVKTRNINNPKYITLLPQPEIAPIIWGE